MSDRVGGKRYREAMECMVDGIGLTVKNHHKVAREPAIADALLPGRLHQPRLTLQGRQQLALQGRWGAP